MSSLRTSDWVRAVLRVYDCLTNRCGQPCIAEDLWPRPSLASWGAASRTRRPARIHLLRLERRWRTRRCTSLMHSSTRVDDRRDLSRARTIGGPHGVPPTRCCQFFLVCGTVPSAAASRGAVRSGQRLRIYGQLTRARCRAGPALQSAQKGDKESEMTHVRVTHPQRNFSVTMKTLWELRLCLTLPRLPSCGKVMGRTGLFEERWNPAQLPSASSVRLA